MKVKLLLFLFVTTFSAAIFYLYQEIYQPTPVNQTQLKIPRGVGFSQINHLLSQNKIIKNPTLFYYYAKITNSLTSLKAGHYNFPIEASMDDVLNILKEGSKDLIKITIAEGKNIFEIAQILEDANIIEAKELFLMRAKEKPSPNLNLPPEASTLEGYLYPETYYFAFQSDPIEIIYAMVQTFHQKTKDLLSAKIPMSIHKIVTLASMIEKETGAAFERTIISGVFYNRIKKGMRLQSDPTTIYGIYERFDGNLRRADLLELTPYNTYKIPSLPPGPIANPGMDSLKAAIAPDQHQYLYFVSRNDGTHIFSRTYEQHKASVNTFQK